MDLPLRPLQGRDLGTRGVDSAYVWVALCEPEGQHRELQT